MADTYQNGYDMETHGDVAHHDTSDEGSDATNTQRVVLMNQYIAGCVRKLATALDAVPEGEGTVLDNTLLVWANEQGRGDHNQENVPIVLIGKAGGAIKQGGRLIDQGRQVHVPNSIAGCSSRSRSFPTFGPSTSAYCAKSPTSNYTPRPRRRRP